MLSQSRLLRDWFVKAGWGFSPLFQDNWVIKKKLVFERCMLEREEAPAVQSRSERVTVRKGKRTETTRSLRISGMGSTKCRTSAVPEERKHFKILERVCSPGGRTFSRRTTTLTLEGGPTGKEAYQKKKQQYEGGGP